MDHCPGLHVLGAEFPDRSATGGEKNERGEPTTFGNAWCKIGFVCVTAWGPREGK